MAKTNKKHGVSIFSAFAVAVMVVAFVVTNASAQDFPHGMVSYWKFDEGNGTIAYDSVGANDGTLVNGPVWTTGRVDGALSFDGVDAKVITSNSPSLNMETNDFTLEAWVYPKSFANRMHIVGKSHAAIGGYKMEFYHPGTGKLQPFISDATGHMRTYGTTDTEVALNQWTHIVVCFIRDRGDGYAGFSVYFNSIKQPVTYLEERSWIYEPLPATQSVDNDWDLHIGADPDYREEPLRWGRLFSGSIDEVAVYNRALSATEIRQHYRAGLIGLGYEVRVKPADVLRTLRKKLSRLVEEMHKKADQLERQADEMECWD